MRADAGSLDLDAVFFLLKVSFHLPLKVTDLVLLAL
jgi:hypothetical protein